MNANNFSTTLSSAASGNSIYTLPFVVTPGTISTVTPTSELYYPCTIWVYPAAGSTVNVTTSFNQITQANWGPGTVSTAATGALLSCPGSITFELVSGTSAVVGIT
jgi:hypothetical protein